MANIMNGLSLQTFLSIQSEWGWGVGGGEVKHCKSLRSPVVLQYQIADHHKKKNHIDLKNK